jgi:hypothetical protein
LTNETQLATILFGMNAQMASPMPPRDPDLGTLIDRLSMEGHGHGLDQVISVLITRDVAADRRGSPRAKNEIVEAQFRFGFELLGIAAQGHEHGKPGVCFAAIATLISRH